MCCAPECFLVMCCILLMDVLQKYWLYQHGDLINMVILVFILNYHTRNYSLMISYDMAVGMFQVFTEREIIISYYNYWYESNGRHIIELKNSNTIIFYFLFNFFLSISENSANIESRCFRKQKNWSCPILPRSHRIYYILIDCFNILYVQEEMQHTSYYSAHKQILKLVSDVTV